MPIGKKHCLVRRGLRKGQIGVINRLLGYGREEPNWRVGPTDLRQDLLGPLQVLVVVTHNADFSFEIERMPSAARMPPGAKHTTALESLAAAYVEPLSVRVVDCLGRGFHPAAIWLCES